MSIIWNKGSGFNAAFSSTDFPTLSDDWTGSVSLYTTFPGTATLTKALVRVGNAMTLSMTMAEILSLDTGPYSLSATFTNTVLGVSISSVDYVTVSAFNGSPATMCKLFGTILKADGTPAGGEGKSLSNTVNGVAIALSWAGVTVTVSSPIADANSGDIIGVEKLETTTNAAGYFERYIIQGLTVTVTCPSFGKSVTVDTTGLDTIDLSTFF